MLFNSIEFLLFFPAVCVLYYALPHRARWILLLGASCLFYMAFEPKYILLCAYVILLDYASGLLIHRANGKMRTALLAASLLLSFAPLFVYKYFDFAAVSAARAAAFFRLSYTPKLLNLLLPIGISFLTFQSFGYCIEVYRGKQKPERRLHYFALFVMFFPQLVAGPIERVQNLLPQFDEVHVFSPANLSHGLRRMMFGLFKKMAVADQLSVIVNAVYGNPDGYGSLWKLIATLCFAFQIYCDFSGYSDIAIGAARVLGFRLMENFDHPYLSASVPEFWRRWHISLSGWFRDYVYFPLGGSRCSALRRDFNLLVTFLISGLWHGAGFTFILWGGLNGIYQVISHHTRALRDKLFGRLPNVLRRAVGVLFTFCLITLTWVFFRAGSISEAFHILRGMIPPSFSAEALIGGRSFTGESKLYILEHLLCGGVALAVMIGSELCSVHRNKIYSFYQSHAAFRTACDVALCILILGLGVSIDAAQFIYFQF